MAYELVAAGASWGGLRALGQILPELPADFPAAIVVVQHRHADSPRDAMSNVLASSSALPVRDIEDKDAIEPGHVFLAPADYHLIIEPGHFALSTDDLVEFARPSVDVMFETAADSYGAGLIAVVLTGLNADGAKGVAEVHKRGGYVIAQDPADAERANMPSAAIDTGLVDRVLGVEEIAGALITLTSARVEDSLR